MSVLRIKLPGCVALEIDRGAVRPEGGKFDAKTSYASKLVSRLDQKGYRLKKLPQKLGALKFLKEKMDSTPTSYYEPMAGVGLSARLFGVEGELFLNDLDEECQQVLRTNFPDAHVSGVDATQGEFPKVDLVFLDFNNFTMTRFLRGDSYYALMVDRAFESAKKFVVLNDCSPFYLRYGPSAYASYSKLLGSTLTTLEDYFFAARCMYKARYKAWIMEAVAYSGESSFQLFRRGRRTGVFRIEEAPGLPVEIGKGLLL